MACQGCSSSSSTPNGCTCKPGRRGDPGPANTISISVEALPAGSDPVVVPTGVSPDQHFNIGFPLSQVPVFSATSQEGPLDVTVTGTPEEPVLNFTIPAGDAGQDGISRYTTLTASFYQPIAATTVVITVGTTAWMSPGDWIYIRGGGWYVVVLIGSPTQAVIRNPGNPDLNTIWGTPPSGAPWFGQWRIPFNAGNFSIVAPIPGALNQVASSGIPGTRGAEGQSGLTPVVTIVSTPPTLPPVTQADAFVLYQNAAPGSTATQSIPYTYNYGTSSWVAGANTVGAAGTRTFFGTADPNVVPVSGSNIGDGYWRNAGPTATLYNKVSASAWTPSGSVPAAAVTTVDIPAPEAAPTPEVLDLAYFGFRITTNKDITLNWSDTNYSEQGEWTVTVENTDASPIAIGFTTSRWERDPAVTTPASIAAGAVQVLRFIKNPVSSKYILTQAFVPTPI
jgi:hypothetical protein